MPATSHSTAHSILITRPEQQGLALCAKLRQRGFTCEAVPVMAIEPIEQTEDGALHKLITKTDGLIIVSLNAAEQLLLQIDTSVLANKPLFTVGKTTAAYLEEQGLSCTYPPEQMDSEGLLALPAMAETAVKGQHFLIVRGEGGREKLAETLQQRGAIVESAALYRRGAARHNSEALQTALPNASIVVINSGESLQYFLELAQQNASQLQDKILLLPGERVATLAREAGFGKIITAANATDDAVIAALEDYLAANSAPINNQSANTATTNQATVLTEMNTMTDSNLNNHKPPQPNSGISKTALLSLLLAMCIGAAGGWYGWQLYLQQQQMQQQLLGLNQSLNQQQTQQQHRLQEQQQLLSETLAQYQAQQAEQQKQAQRQLQQQLEAQQQKLDDLSKADRSQWLLAEAEYLLHLANQQLQLQHNIAAAITSLNHADKALLAVKDSRLSDVRRLLAEEKTALALLEQVDKEGIYFQLAALSKQLQTMPVINLQAVAEPTIHTTANNSDVNTEANTGLWQKIQKSFRNMLSKLAAVIVVQHHDESLGALLSAEQQVSLKLNQRILLEQAQLAALQGHAAVYRDSLQKSRDYFDQFYTMPAAAKAPYLQQFEQLIQTPVAVTLPDISASSKALQQVLKQRQAEVQP